MKLLPTQPTSIVNVVLNSLRAYPLILPKIFWLVVLSSAAHIVIPFLYKINPTFAGVGAVGAILLTWFLYPVIMWLSEAELEGHSINRPEAYKRARERYLAVLGSNVVFFAIGLFMALLIYGLDLMFHITGHHPFFFAISIGASIYIFIMLYFAIPSIVLEKNVIIDAFFRSAELVKDNWWRVFIPLGLVGGAILGFEALGVLFTGKSRLFLFTGYHFILQIAFYPLLVAVTLMVLNDLKLRKGD